MNYLSDVNQNSLLLPTHSLYSCHSLSQDRGSWGAPGAAPAVLIGSSPAVVGLWLGRGEETSPAVASRGQELIAPGGLKWGPGIWAE